MQLNRKVANDEVEGAMDQTNHLVDVTAKHTTLKPNLDSLSELMEGCSNLKKLVILTSAVASLEQVSPKSILDSVGEDIHQQVGKDVFTGAG